MQIVVIAACQDSHLSHSHVHSLEVSDVGNGGIAGCLSHRGATLGPAVYSLDQYFLRHYHNRNQS